MPLSKKTKLVCVNKTISIPLGLLTEILEASELMGRNFSDTLVVLSRLGLAIYKDQNKGAQKAAEDVLE